MFGVSVPASSIRRDVRTRIGRIVAKVERHLCEPSRRVSLIVIKLSWLAERVVMFYRHHKKEEWYAKGCKHAIKSKWLSHEVPLQRVSSLDSRYGLQ